jgi:putative sigma-54 modulation protein
MQISITGHQINVTRALRDYVGGKLERPMRHFDQLLDVKVVLGLEKLKHRAEATIKASRKTIHAVADAADMYAAIDALADKLDAQVRKHKEKVTSRGRTSARKTARKRSSAG